MFEKDKVKCLECGWCGTDEEVLYDVNPFNLLNSIQGCPKCKDINTISPVCDEPECWREVSCGTPTVEGYRSTCGEHAPKEDT